VGRQVNKTGRKLFPVGKGGGKKQHGGGWGCFHAMLAQRKEKTTGSGAWKVENEKRKGGAGWGNKKKPWEKGGGLSSKMPLWVLYWPRARNLTWRGGIGENELGGKHRAQGGANLTMGMGR